MIEAKSFGNSRQNPWSAGVNCPQAHASKLQTMTPEPIFQPRPQMLADQVGNSRRKTHLEAMIANSPGHRVFRILDHC